MKYFITGGGGFIGYHICQELMKEDDNTIVIYDAQKHYIPLDKSNWAAYQNYRLKSLEKYKDRITKIRGDVTDRGLLRESLEKHKPDIIIHLAALPIAVVSNKYPEEAKRDVLEGTITLLDVLREVSFKFKKLVHTSSSMVYGHFKKDNDGKIIPAVENQECNPLGLYDAMKLCGEYIVKAYSNRFGIPYTIIRPSAVYGPTECNHRVTETFVKNALEGKELILDNGGLQQVDFSYIKDVAKGFVLAAKSEKALGQTFNLTRGEGRSIKELAEIVTKIIPSAKIVDVKMEVFRPNRGTLDISKARELLGYNPKYSLERGMAEYIEFFKNSLKNNK